VNTFHIPVYCTLVHKRRHSTHKSRSSIGTAVIQLAYTAITAMYIACVTAAVNDSPAPLVSSSQSLLPGRPHGIARCGIWLPMFRVCVCLCLFVKTTNCAKTAEPIVMLFGTLRLSGRTFRACETASQNNSPYVINRRTIGSKAALSSAHKGVPLC